MIRFSKKLYLTKTTEKKLWSIKLKLYTGAGMAGVCFILLSENNEDVFDIVPAYMFKQRRFRRLDHTVVGIGENMRACRSLISEIVLEHYDVTGSFLELRKDIEERVIG